MKDLYVISSKQLSKQLKNMLDVFTETSNAVIINTPESLTELRNKKILFAVELNNIGSSPEIVEIISKLYSLGEDSLIGSTAALLIHSHNDLYTKSAAAYIIFLANNLGCSFIGHSLMEATGSLNNLLTWKKTLDLPLEDICLLNCSKLSQRLMKDEPVKFQKPRVVALHASSKSTSNTLMLWNMIKFNITGCSIEEYNVGNGTIHDCTGCSFTTCIHYSKQNSCFYGGAMVKEIVPAIERADALVFISPNYNDAVSANLTAVINRITALYRKMSFYEKYLFSIVVSGSSGSDSVAKQLICALNINKGFRLSPYSAITATANDPGAIKSVSEIDNLALKYANNLIKSIKK